MNSPQTLISEMNRRLQGQESAIELLVSALLARGHVLIEGLPGLGKTQMARDLSALLDLSFGRIQCTPDLMPTDITGGDVLDFNQSERSSDFRFVPGPLFHEVVLVDEINRATPKAQAALLEAMAEQKVSYGSQAHDLPQAFFVMATQNPFDLEGIYPLPEAQLDRFLMRVPVNLPDIEVVENILQKPPLENNLSALVGAETLKAWQKQADQIKIDDSVLKYASCLIKATDPQWSKQPSTLHGMLRFGVSIRGGHALLQAARALALVRGDDFVRTSIIREVLPGVFGHRVALSWEGQQQNIDVAALLIESIPDVPDHVQKLLDS